MVTLYDLLMNKPGGDLQLQAREAAVMTQTFGYWSLGENRICGPDPKKSKGRVYFLGGMISWGRKAGIFHHDGHGKSSCEEAPHNWNGSGEVVGDLWYIKVKERN